jgi:predicted SAM-dependent methyltransferase
LEDNLKVLYIPLEFKTWRDASHMPYTCNYAFEEGFDANGIEYFTIPAIYEPDPSQSSPWLQHAKKLCEGRQFDQVWLEIVHTRYDDDFLEWLSLLCEVRIGFMGESMETHPDELVNNPAGTLRRQTNLKHTLKHVTHVVAVDEKDVEQLNNSGSIQAKWLWDAGLQPRRSINLAPLPSPIYPALFYGALYGVRKKWMELEILKGLILRPEASLEFSTDLPQQFDELNTRNLRALAGQHAVDPYHFSKYMDSLRKIRKECFSLWQDGLKEGAAIINLPQFGKAYASRVSEGIAAGRPVITWEIPGRPKTKALFENGKEILLYDQNSPEQLRDHIQRVIKEPRYAQNIAENARKKLLAHHNVEELVRQILLWTEVQTTTKAKHNVAIPSSENLVRNMPLRLHLGCGEQYLEGYTNIDYPRSGHTVMDVKADLYADITTLDFTPASVDEIRLHHVFEHFSRVTALALLIRWHEWLKPGGKLVIETPDLEGSAKILLSDSPWQVKTATVRHLAGDQADTWAYHVDHWFPERFQRTLSRLEFTDIQTTKSNWPHEPYLANVTVVATKGSTLTKDELLTAADSILLESTVSLSEKATFSVWQKQLRDFLSGGQPPKIRLSSADTSFDPKIDSHLPLDEIHDFNQRSRDRWVKEKAATVLPGAHVLDIGAGTCPYRSIFSHCEYKTHDFKKYTGEKLGGTAQYGNIDYISEITSIPVADASFDVILCTEVLEHIPEPGVALQEMVRILRPGGTIFLTAPLGSGLHQLPYHFYGGFSPEWYRYWAATTGLSVVEIVPNGGFFRLLAQECARAANFLSSCSFLSPEDVNGMRRLLSDKLPRFFFTVEDSLFIDQFTVGYHVELHKPSAPKFSAAVTEAWAQNDRFDKIMRLKQAYLEESKNEL